MKHTDDFTHKEEEALVGIPGDLSPRVIELARVLDRLPSGTHIIIMVKPEVRAKEWSVEIQTVQYNRKMILPKRMNGS